MCPSCGVVKDGVAVCWSIAVTAFLVMTQVELSNFPKIVGSHKNGQVPFAIAVWLLALLPWDPFSLVYVLSPQ